MKNKTLIFCQKCSAIKKHIPKKSAIIENQIICSKCGKINQYSDFTLLKVGDVKNIQKSNKIEWIEFDSIGEFKSKHENPKTGFALLFFPINDLFSIQTTKIKEIIKQTDNLIHFKTQNSEYKLFISK